MRRWMISVLLGGLLTAGWAGGVQATCLTFDGELGGLSPGWDVGGGGPQPFSVVEPSSVPFSPPPPNPVPNAHTGTWVAYAGDPGTGGYPNYMDALLFTPTFIAAAGDQIRYWERLDSEVNFDYAVLQIEQVNPSGAPIVLDSQSGNNWGWKHRVFAVPPEVVGNEIRVVWRFTSDYTITFMGWLLDDIFVGQGSGACDWQPACGNGTLDGPRESCDDSNTNPGDGCNGWCQTECGNGSLQGSETCDDGMTNGLLGQPCRCNVSCDGYTEAVVCGDGYACGSETCDDGGSNGYPCYCNATCDGTTPTTCGDGYLCGTETCDNGGANGQPCYCNTTCDGTMPPSCGDGYACGGEGCDDGVNSGDCGSCRTDCSAPFNFCGDSSALCGEICDDGPGGSCFDDCSAANVCGDGVVFDGEICDEGPLNGTCDHCSAACDGPHNVCGDGTTLCGEGCDDGLDNGTCGFCNAVCVAPLNVCGDGTILCGETCDDGNTLPFDGCDAVCLLECGNGTVEGIEECDDGNLDPGDGCSASCEIECGNGIVDPGEMCDDGDLLSCGTPCRADCDAATGCGDGVLCGAEMCDDGNFDSGDGCASDCTVECTFRPMLSWDFDDGDDAEWFHAPGGLNPVDLWHVSGDGMQDGLGFWSADPGLRRYGEDMANGLYSPLIELGGGAYSIYQLRFRHRFDFADYGTDYGAVELVPNFGSSGPVSLYNYYGIASSWDEAVFDLSPYAGDWIFLRWMLNTDNYSGSGLEGEGWRIDDVRIMACTICGNGTLEFAELCDDGNFDLGDGCDGDCIPEACGNGYFQFGEGCDDGNTAPGDGCDAACQVECGNGSVDAGEVCDDGNTDNCSGACRGDCDAPVTGCGDGVLCTPEVCDDGNTLDGDGCDSACAYEICGDGIVNNNEGCDDGGNTDGDGCDALCRIEACGNGFVQFGEECDDGNALSDDGCSSACAAEYCGDGTTQIGIGETCDDGNTDVGDGCDALCRAEVCGNGFLQAGEACDAGVNNGNCGFCNTACTGPHNICGDGVVRCNEQCDDGGLCSDNGAPCTSSDRTACQDPGTAGCYTINGDGCDLQCKIEVCGNGIVQSNEACDNGKHCDDPTYPRTACVDDAQCVGLGDGLCLPRSFDGCDASCGAESCGDFVVQAGLGEDCDDGGTINFDGCDAQCHIELCGAGSKGIYFDGIEYVTEECDDGNSTPGDGCGADCTLEYCGDGVIQPLLGEACDDGSTDFLASTSGDGCDENCQLEVCGNGIIGFKPDGSGGWTREDCDDGNLADGDGCGSLCFFEPTLTVITSPPGAQIYLYGTPEYYGSSVGSTVSGAGLSIPNLPIGWMEVVAVLPNFKPVHRRIFLREATETLQIALPFRKFENFTQVHQLFAGASPINVGADAHSTWVDWNCDGTSDLLVGRADGRISIFENTSAFEPVLVDPAQFVQIDGSGGPEALDVGTQARPFALDFDADGRMDLLIGNAAGDVMLAPNLNGPRCDPVLEPPSLLAADSAPIQVTGPAAPTAGDFDNNGRFDIVVGTGDGSVLYFANTGTLQIPDFEPPETLLSGLAHPLHPTLADFNQNGTLDLVINNNDCGMDLYPNYGTGTGAERLDGGSTVGFPLFDQIETRLCDILPQGAVFTIAGGLSFSTADVVTDSAFLLDLTAGDAAGNLFLLQATRLPGDINNDFDANGVDAIHLNLCLGEDYSDSSAPSTDDRALFCRLADSIGEVNQLGIDSFGYQNDSIDIADRQRMEEFFGSNYLPPDCGNGVIEPGEECDDGGICSDNGAPCERSIQACAYPETAYCMPSGLCSDNGAPCVPDLALCSTSLATCNPQNSGWCDSTCRFPCGNGALDSYEGCDDGNRLPGDGCDGYCQIECGNGWIDALSNCGGSTSFEGQCSESCDEGGRCVSRNSPQTCVDSGDCDPDEECRLVGYPFPNGTKACIDPWDDYCNAYNPCWDATEVCVATESFYCSQDCRSIGFEYYNPWGYVFCGSGAEVTDFLLATKGSYLKISIDFFAASPETIPFTLAVDMDTDQNRNTGRLMGRFNQFAPIGIEETLVMENIQYNPGAGKWNVPNIRFMGRPKQLDGIFFGGPIGGGKWRLEGILSYKNVILTSFGQFNYIGYTFDDPSMSLYCGQFPLAWTLGYARSDRTQRCGNGEIEPGEQCDDGNNAPADPLWGDSCDPFCNIPLCGDGIIQYEMGEQCDGAGQCSDNSQWCTPYNKNGCGNPGTADCLLDYTPYCLADCTYNIFQ